MARYKSAVITCYQRRVEWCKGCPADIGYIHEDDGWDIRTGANGRLRVRRGDIDREFSENVIICLNKR